MTTTPDYLPTHLVAVTYDAGPAGSGCRAECDCGWRSDAFGDDYAAADLAASEHRDEMATPLDELDRLINRLLDLQDDLAQTVLWLIDSWRPGMPVPGCWQLDDPARSALHLLAYCSNDSELAHAADVLGAGPMDDPTPDSCGHRYRRVRRDFGQVCVDVFTSIKESEAA
jgi:hypothetical protein